MPSCSFMNFRNILISQEINTSAIELATWWFQSLILHQVTFSTQWYQRIFGAPWQQGNVGRYQSTDLLQTQNIISSMWTKCLKNRRYDMVLTFYILWKFELVSLVLPKQFCRTQNTGSAQHDYSIWNGGQEEIHELQWALLCKGENDDTDVEMAFFTYISNTRSVMVVKTELSGFHPL